MSLRESTDIKSVQKFQLKPGQNPIGKCVETRLLGNIFRTNLKKGTLPPLLTILSGKVKLLWPRIALKPHGKAPFMELELN